MALASGTRFGHYEIIQAIGAGGMGEVYRARDSKLGRDVAVKTLPESFSKDPERVARFQREARLLAALSHPHVAAVHGLEESGGAQCLIMELVEGETLAQRLTQGPLPVAEAIVVARQLADGLHAAHERGIIHRDLKPSNIAFAADGQIKILDFGLAKFADVTTGNTPVNDSISPTLSMAATNAGVILGTAAYISPELAKGRAADKRSDVWAFGCVFFEMLSAQRTFDGDDVTDTLATILKTEPDWSLLPEALPKAILRLIQSCLEKDSRKRLADISTVLFVIDEQARSPVPVPAAEVAPSVRRWPVVILVAAVAAVAAAALTLVISGRWTRPQPSPMSRLAVIPPSGGFKPSGLYRDLAIAPDGRAVVFTGATSQLFVRSLDQLDPVVLTLSGLGGLPVGPFFSPDAKWIGFFDNNLSLMKVAVTGGPAIALTNMEGAVSQGATWGPDGNIVFANSNSATGLLQVSGDGGGAITVLTTPNRKAGEADHVWPEFLPGGRAILFTITSTSGQIDDAQIALLDLATGTQRILVRGGSHAKYLSSGHLIFARAGTIRAVPFDIERLNVLGEPVPILTQVMTTASGAANLDVSHDGTLVYFTGGLQTSVRSLLWVDRQGHEEPVGAPDRVYVYPRLSPDGSRIALDIRDQDNDIWMWDIGRKTLTRFTADLGLDRFPVWTADGKHVIFNSDRSGAVNLYWQASDGASPAERLSESADGQFPTSVSRDGKQIIFGQSSGGDPRDLMMLTLEPERRTEALVQTAAAEQNGQISPNGRWLAYDTDETGRFEVYVRPFPDVKSGHWQVSNAGGIGPVWSRDGQELFYWSATGAMMVVRVGNGTQWSAAAPVKLFDGSSYMRGNTAAAPTFDISLDGQRFLIIKPVADTAQKVEPTSLVVVQNWFDELKKVVRK